jgi:hypothetical protein
MHTLVSFLIIFSLIFSYLVLYHKVDLINVLDVMHSAFTRQFIFELIPFIILFTTRELKFIDIESAPNFFNSVIGRSMIGMIAFTFATYTLSTVNPNKIGSVLSDPMHSLRMNSFTNQNIGSQNGGKEPNKEILNFNKFEIEANEKLLPYALIN